MVDLGAMSKDAPVQCERLRSVLFDYIDFQGRHHNSGEIVVMDAVASHVATIFENLYALKFPIQRAQPITFYDGDDGRSMTANNTSAFNYRAITGKKSLSLHAYGLAIDLNPIQNPFIEFSTQGNAQFSPEAGIKFANRQQFRMSKKKRSGFAEDVIGTFADNGFLYWGGFWDTPIDYQHFQVSREMANLMTLMSVSNSKLFFDNYVNWYQSCKAMYPVAYSEYRVNDYVVYLHNKLQVKSLTATFTESPQKVLGALQTPFKRSALCVKQ